MLFSEKILTGRIPFLPNIESNSSPVISVSFLIPSTAVSQKNLSSSSEVCVVVIMTSPPSSRREEISLNISLAMFLVICCITWLESTTSKILSSGTALMSPFRTSICLPLVLSALAPSSAADANLSASGSAAVISPTSSIKTGISLPFPHPRSRSFLISSFSGISLIALKAFSRTFFSLASQYVLSYSPSMSCIVSLSSLSGY